MRGGILAVPRGEIEAAKAAGMSSFTTYRLVILPRAFSIILPAYSNEVIILLKGTSLASTITLLELMGQAQLAASNTYQPIQVFVIAGRDLLPADADHHPHLPLAREAATTATWPWRARPPAPGNGARHPAGGYRANIMCLFRIGKIFRR